MKRLFLKLCNCYLTFIVWLGKGVAAWSLVAFASWHLASFYGKLLVVSPTPSLENKVFLIERLNLSSYQNIHRSLKGQVIAACLDEQQTSLVEKSRLPNKENVASEWLGCERGAWIKRVAAVGGDVVEISNGLISVNGAPISVIPKFERNGELQTVYSVDGISGVFELASDQVFLVGDHNLSFDSRYVGLFDLNQLKGRVTHAL